MKLYEFNRLWDWCSFAANNDEFWRRFTLAANAYDAHTRERLMKFACTMWYS